MKRYLYQQILQDLEKKMVFVAGPRQVGKTTLGQEIQEELGGTYLNWDVPEHRQMILENTLPESDFWYFDEIHKYPYWRDFLKGLFDRFKGKKKILVTGSARLDYYRYAGDSLQGRYHYLRLHPLSCAELNIKTQKNLEELLALSGFPEPYFSKDAREAKRWTAQYRYRLMEEEVKTLEQVKNISSVELLATRLPALVGSPLSINALRQDLQVSHKALSNWVDILERIYHVFRVYPFGGPNIRAIKKEAKHYHFDWALIKNPGARFENFIGCHLYKWVHFRSDVYGDNIELRYFRDKDQREVDFVLSEEGEPTHLIECKLSSGQISKHLRYLKKKYPDARAIQVQLEHTEHTINLEGIETISALELLKELI